MTDGDKLLAYPDLRDHVRTLIRVHIRSFQEFQAPELLWEPRVEGGMLITWVRDRKSGHLFESVRCSLAGVELTAAEITNGILEAVRGIVKAHNNWASTGGGNG